MNNPHDGLGHLLALAGIAFVFVYILLLGLTTVVNVLIQAPR
jgi:hypothetical protein